MSSAFINHFKIAQSELEAIGNELKTGETLIEACIDRKLVDENSYLEWAKNHYGLAILKENFLSSNNQVEMLLKRYKNVFPKNVIPFFEWDGVIFVMCLEPQDFKAPQAIQYILAPIDVIKKYSQKNETKIASESEIPVQIEKENTNPLFQNLLKDEPQSVPSLNFEMPEGLSSGLSSTTPNSNISNEKVDMSDAPKTSEIESPEGLNFPPLPKEEKEDHVVEEKVTSDDLKNILKMGENTDSKSPTKIIHIEEEELKVETKIFNLPQNPPKMEIPFDVPVTSEKVATHHSSQEYGLFKPIFDSLSKHYKQCMILSIKNKILTPYKWDSSWQKDPHSQSAIDLGSASIFRIVHDTLKPYHGYIIPNPINDSFFQIWNKGKYPEHVTICPIVIDKKIVGMILGGCSKEDAKKIQLNHIESIANQCVPSFQKEFSIKAA